MKKIEILDDIIVICKLVFNKESIELSENTTTNDIEEWDSLTHLMLISEIEKKYSIKFTLDEIMKSNSIGMLITIITKKLEG